MGITKTAGFDESLIEMSAILKAIGHPARLAILKYLAETSDCVGNDLVEILPLAQPTISRHLSELKQVGLVRGVISGQHINYCINPVQWGKVQEYLQSIKTQLDCTSSVCC